MATEGEAAGRQAKPFSPEDVIESEFSRARWRDRPGYDEDSVDDALDEMVVSMRDDELTADRFEQLRDGIKPAGGLLKAGYDTEQVDEFLDELAEQVGPHPLEAAEQYADETRLQERRQVWRGTPDGTQPQNVALDAVAAQSPRDVVELGCGTGEFGVKMAELMPTANLVVTDQSARMVEIARGKGLLAEQVDATRLPFADDSFDAVAAMWMLYHVPQLQQTLAEVRRVLRTGGVFVAMTNGDEHLAQLLTDAGQRPVITQFSRENGAASLRRHFADVTQTDFDTRAVFPDHAAAARYLATFNQAAAEHLPAFDGPREYAGAATLFIAR